MAELGLAKNAVHRQRVDTLIQVACHELRVGLIDQAEDGNRDGIGAKIQVDFSADGTARTLYLWVNSGGSFGANPLIAHLGVGKAERIRQIKITWPATGAHTVLKDVKVDSKLIVVSE